uniref:Uncharacterized protein n=1 Tax=Branchiostoma floridae TaxID=7739 RepID=C3Y8M8_BRAFL|eukprot:XP_002607455.1 hypothetical protein BRAFLDRAFT_69881 [Branchiostoma floridae]
MRNLERHFDSSEVASDTGKRPALVGLNIKAIADRILGHDANKTTRHTKLKNVRLIGENAICLERYFPRLMLCLSPMKVSEHETDEAQLSELEEILDTYYNMLCLFLPESGNLTVWTITKAIPYHARKLYDEYGVGYGGVSMQGKECLKLTNRSKAEGNSNKFFQVFRMEYIKDFYLQEHNPSPSRYRPHFNLRVPVSDNMKLDAVKMPCNHVICRACYCSFQFRQPVGSGVKTWCLTHKACSDWGLRRAPAGTFYIYSDEILEIVRAAYPSEDDEAWLLTNQANRPTRDEGVDDLFDDKNWVSPTSRHWTDTFLDSDHDEEVVVVPEIEPNKLHPEMAKLEPQTCQRPQSLCEEVSTMPSQFRYQEHEHGILTLLLVYEQVFMLRVKELSISSIQHCCDRRLRFDVPPSPISHRRHSAHSAGPVIGTRAGPAQDGRYLPEKQPCAVPSAKNGLVSLTHDSLVKHLKLLLTSAGFPAAQYSGHSFRRGGHLRLALRGRHSANQTTRRPLLRESARFNH